MRLSLEDRWRWLGRFDRSMQGAQSEQQPERRHARRQQRTSFEARIRLLCAALVGPGVAVVLGLLLHQKATPYILITTLGALLLLGLVLSSVLLEYVVRPLQTLSNVIGALREEDYAFRARGERADDALGELAREVNALADMLQEQRVGALEAAALLRRVVVAMDAPVLGFDPAGVLRLVNPAAERLFGLSSLMSTGNSAAALGLGAIYAEQDEGVVVLEKDNRSVRWMVHRSTFRQRGVPHTLILLSDVSAALREEERQAWQRLIRVLGHEINNSLAPIKSIAGSLRARALAQGIDDGGDLEHGLRIIEGRAESLHRFVQAYRQLAQLPPPKLNSVPLRPLVERTLALETRLAVELRGGPDVTLRIDPDQMEQLLINLVRNGVEAAQTSRERSGVAQPVQPHVALHWQITSSHIAIAIEDNGLGITNPSNLFVPFYTTKSGGSGVGLALARQIAEAHGGSVTLVNRPQGGCRATILLPVSPSLVKD
jgi:two-component system nitrogen regulation sensor histidine kinase NtrY